MSDVPPTSDAEWRERLTPEQYRVCRAGGTEAPFSGTYWDHKASGTYRCVCCNAALFHSDAKYDSGTGWPSFFDAMETDAVRVREDRSHGMVRDEVVCARCGAHLGHLFADGPEPTGLRYCVNSVALRLDPTPADGER